MHRRPAPGVGGKSAIQYGILHSMQCDVAGEEIYMAMDKGPINDQHILLLPIEHRSNTLALSAGAYSELERYLSALRTCFASKVSSIDTHKPFRCSNHACSNKLILSKW